MNAGRLVLGYLRSHMWLYIIGILSIIASTFVQSLFPLILGEATDKLKNGHIGVIGLAPYVWELIGIAIFSAVMVGIGRYIVQRSGREFEWYARKSLFSKWETLTPSYFQRRSVGELISHALSDVQAVRDSISMGVNQTTNAVFSMLATIYMMIRFVDAKLTIISILPLIVVPFIIVYWGPKVRNLSRKVQEALSAMSQRVEESIGGIRVVKAFANEEVENVRFQASVDNIVDAQLRMVRMSSLFQSLIPLMGSFSYLIALGYGGTLAMDGRISLGRFVSFSLYLGMLIMPLQQVGNVINTAQRATASLVRLGNLLAEEPEVKDDEETVVHTEPFRGDVNIKNLSFTYPNANRPALSNITVHVKPGKTLGIVGRTGSGKTTLVNLLVRAYNSSPGAIMLDGVDILDWRLAEVREGVAYVPQDGFLFSSTLEENIGFSDEEMPKADVIQAAKDAEIYDNIIEFPHGFDTEIGERGVTLSGGQRQRTAIARALAKRAPLLILDDSLSAVDTKTEEAILQHWRRIRKGKTAIIIAHRLSALKDVDEIIVLDDGVIVERGTHASLLKQGGTYAALYQMQQMDGGEQHVR